MTDHIDSLREDIAYVRAIAADDGRIPRVIGANFLAVGLSYGLPIVLAWATLAGLVDLPRDWTSWVAIWSTALYLPISLALSRGFRGCVPARRCAPSWGSGQGWRWPAC